MIAVIDTGICNLRSVTKALEVVGARIRVVHTPEEVAASGASGLVLPGVGALRDCVASLQRTGLDQTVRDWMAADRPFLGVCLGMQALFEHSEEGNVRGLAIFRGSVVRFRRPAEFKIPHMGWNTVRFRQRGSPLAVGLLEDADAFYFVHSFYCVPADPSLVLAECDYGGTFCAAIGHGRCFATQFHPEKSQAKGLQVYRNFVGVAEAAAPRKLQARRHGRSTKLQDPSSREAPTSNFQLSKAIPRSGLVFAMLMFHWSLDLPRSGWSFRGLQ